MSGSANLRAAIIIVSETAHADPSTDKCIPALQEIFATDGDGKVDASDTAIVPDDVLQIQHAIIQRTDDPNPVNLIVTSGGTGFTVKDVTPEVGRDESDTALVQIHTSEHERTACMLRWYRI